ncbi:MAG: GNAT family N-acetyltransferase [Pseudodesulfovibrio sp.]|nr:GNAT family N-acetyltransferase [Pseudodesulfovibrio sp.]
MDALSITRVGPEKLDDIQPLWERLNLHHSKISQHFSDRFKCYTFSDRKAELLTKSHATGLAVFIARQDAQTAGYVIATLTLEKEGEIDSLFVAEEFRGKRIGDSLMQAALKWLDDTCAKSKTIAVVHGNEQAHSFYARYGFQPHITWLGQPES